MYGKWSWVLASLAVVPSALAWAQEEGKSKKDPDKKQAQDGSLDRWIRQLGSQDFKEREEAAQKLRDAGKSALPQLKEVMKDSDDAEIRWQARKLAREIEKGSASSGLKPLQERDEAQPVPLDRGPGGRGRGSALDERFDQMFRDLEKDFGITVPRGRFFQEDFFKGLEQQLHGPGHGWQDFQGEGRSFSMQIGPEKVRVEVKEKGGDGKEKSEVFEAPNLESFREKYPEVAKKYLDGGGGQFVFRLGDPNTGLWQFGNPGAAEPQFRVFRNGLKQQRDGGALRTLRPLDAPQDADTEEVPVPEGERLGVYIAQEVPEDLREQLHLDEGVGVRVDRTIDGSLAESLGIRQGDVLLAINGKPITGPPEIRAVLKSLSDKDEVRVELARKGKKLTVKGAKGSRIR